MSDYGGIRGQLVRWQCECCERWNVRQEPDLENTCSCSPCETCDKLLAEDDDCAECMEAMEAAHDKK